MILIFKGIANLTSEEAQQIAGADPEYLIRDLYNAIETGNYPQWNMYVQIMTPEQAAKNPYDPFDDSKVWLHADFPLIPVGRFVLNKNPKSYFAEIEQIAFDVAHMIPGNDILSTFLFYYLTTYLKFYKVVGIK